MSDKKKQKAQEKKSKKNDKREKEIEEIFIKADQVDGEQLNIDGKGNLSTENEIKNFALADIDNPEKKYDVYYNGIRKLLMEELPSGKSFEEARRLIYDQKNILINRGKKKNSQGIRGSDGRMAYIPDIELAFNIVTEWVVENGTPSELYQKFYGKNVELGYHKE
jgi:hypothetical protein